jgi:VanZ family protein
MKKKIEVVGVPGVLFLIWFAGLWILSSLPGEEVPLPQIPHIDKVGHFGYFMAGGFLLAWFLRQALGWRVGFVVLIAVTTLAAIGAFDEIHQLFTRGRAGADIFDWLADVLGALAGASGFLFIYGMFNTRATDP